MDHQHVSDTPSLVRLPAALVFPWPPARQVLDRAIVTEKERPPSIKWRFQIEDGFQEEVTQSRDRQPHYVTIDGQRMSITPGCN